jgi:hypothetical protein
VEGKKIFFLHRKIKFVHFLFYLRYRQEAYLYENKIYLFGGGGSSGISFSLENVSQ